MTFWNWIGLLQLKNKQKRSKELHGSGARETLHEASLGLWLRFLVYPFSMKSVLYTLFKFWCRLRTPRPHSGLVATCLSSQLSILLSPPLWKLWSLFGPKFTVLHRKLFVGAVLIGTEPVSGLVIYSLLVTLFLFCLCECSYIFGSECVEEGVRKTTCYTHAIFVTA